MPNTLHDIKDKLLSALDRDYNVVDMATVIEVISILEKTCITKDALEKTRIGKFVNELRKKTSNDQLAKRAKQLVKKWRKLLPVADHTGVNGERVVGSIGTPPVGMTPSGPGPGPGVGPGPGPGFANKPASPAIGVGNNTGRFASPAMVSERVASPCSSASSSPHLPASRHQGSNRTSIPSMHVPPPSKTVGHTIGHSQVIDKTPASDPALSNAVSNGNSATSNLLFKPVSPALLAVQANSGIKHGTIVSGTNIVAHPKLHSPVGSPASLESSSRSRSPCFATGKTLSSRHRHETSHSAQHPPFTPHSGSGHSSLELAKTNAANKRLRKENQSERTLKKKCGIDRLSPVGMVNGMDPVVGIMPSKGSAFVSFKPATESETTCNKDSENRKKKKILADHEVIGVGTKLQKVKTTQQLIAELQAKKGGASLNLSSENFRTNNVSFSMLSKRPGNHVLFGSDADVSKTKLELMDRFLQSSTSDKRQLDAKYERESPTAESVQDDLKFSSLSTEDKLLVRVDPITEEINKLMSSLPEIGSVDLSDDEYVYVKPEFTESNSLRIDSEKWEHVNGEYDRTGNWKEWHETTSRESYLGDSLQILPYVNIDW